MSMAPPRRGALLLSLQKQYPAALAVGLLSQQLAVFMETPADLDRDLAYLEAKGLLHVAVQTFANGASLRMATITPRGIDVVDGSLVEPGVSIARGG
jgi:hypothetical protein